MLSKDTENYLSFFACICFSLRYAGLGLLVEKNGIQLIVRKIYPRLMCRILSELVVVYSFGYRPLQFY